jgi:hypothetical protein
MSDAVEVSHREIYDRLIAVETKVDRIDKNTDGVVKAFEAASGAFLVLEWIAKAAKPIIFIVGIVAGVLTWVNHK